jgi:hypothetical protein
VYVVDDLRAPGVVNLVHGQSRLGLREGVPVAVVVVADVVVVKLGRVRPLEGRAERAVVPALDDVHAVGVERGDEQDDGVAEYLLHLGLVRGGEAVRDEHPREVRADLGRMHPAGDEHDAAAAADEPLRGAVARGAERARVCEAALNLLQLGEAREVLGRADGGEHEGRAQRRLAQLLELHARARGVEAAEVLDGLRPRGQLAVVAGAEAEHVLGRRDSGGGRNARGARRRHCAGQSAACVLARVRRAAAVGVRGEQEEREQQRAGEKVLRHGSGVLFRVGRACKKVRVRRV